MRCIFRCFLLSLLPVASQAQGFEFPMIPVALNDLSAFKPAGQNWQIAGDVRADLARDEMLLADPGTGILVNRPDAQHRDNLVSSFEHGDLNLELDVLMARHSNSGIYLEGRYEVQLLDSWGKKHPAFSDIGGIYQRWDDNKPEGQKGFQGIPPRLNAARAPGLWQHLRIEFQAPRFDPSGRKIANARFIRVVLNGVTVQENVELNGPTRGAAYPGEAAAGPILIQGDHGPVAFRNIRYRSYGGHPAALTQLKYRYFSGEYDYLPHFPSLKPDAVGDADGLSWEYAKGDNDFALQFHGTLLVPENGEYRFTLSSNANSMLIIGGDTVIGQAWWTRSNTATLKAGAIPVEITYCKVAEWLQPGLGLFVEGPGFRKTPLHMPSSYLAADPVAPILLNPGHEPELMRCFIDIQQNGKKKRLVHAISVGYPEQISFTLDLDNGALVQAWKGGFLDMTPMWDNRGDGHADPLGSVLYFGDAPQVAGIAAAWPDSVPPADTFRLGGYLLDAGGNPTFQYSIAGIAVNDRLTPGAEGKWLVRELTFTGAPSTETWFRLATGQDIQQVAPDTWAVNSKQYYIQLPAGTQPQIRKRDGNADMLLPATGTIRYNLVW